jgi:hypothetical protein
MQDFLLPERAEFGESGNLASRGAREIEAEIIRRGWPIGHNLGRESAGRM